MFFFYTFGDADHYIKIPFIQASLDPSLFPRDLTVGMKSTYSSYLYLLLQPFENRLGLEAACYIVYAFSTLLFLGSVYLLASHLFGNRMVGLLSVILLFLQKPTLGGVGVVTFDYYLTERSVAFSLLLFALYVLFRQRLAVAGILFGIAADIQSIIALNTGLFVFFFFLFKGVHDRDLRGVFRRSAWFFVPMGIGMLPFILSQLQVSREGGLLTWVDPTWWKIIALCGKQYTIAVSKSVSMFLGYTLSFFLLLLLAGLQDRKPVLPAQANRVLWASAVTALLGFALFVLFSRAFPLLLGIDLCFHRTSRLFVVLLYMTLAHLLFLSFGTCRLLLLVCVCWIAMAGNVVELLRDLLALNGFVLLLAVIRKFRPEIPFRLPAQLGRIDSRIGAWTVTAAFVLLVFFTVGRHLRGDLPFVERRSGSIDTQRWIQEHTPRDALILSPPEDTTFRVYARRSLVFTILDHTYSNIDRAFALESRERLHDLVGVKREPPEVLGLFDFRDRSRRRDNREEAQRRVTRFYGSLGEEKLLSIIHKYGVDYLVMPVQNSLSFPKRFENDTYAVYGPFLQGESSGEDGGQPPRKTVVPEPDAAGDSRLPGTDSPERNGSSHVQR